MGVCAEKEPRVREAPPLDTEAHQQLSPLFGRASKRPRRRGRHPPSRRERRPSLAVLLPELRWPRSPLRAGLGTPPSRPPGGQSPQRSPACVAWTIRRPGLTPNYCRMHKFGPTICACGPRIIAGMHISQICINKAPFGNNMVRSLLRALLKSLQKSLQTNDMNIGGPRGQCFQIHKFGL